MTNLYYKQSPKWERSTNKKLEVPFNCRIIVIYFYYWCVMGISLCAHFGTLCSLYYSRTHLSLMSSWFVCKSWSLSNRNMNDRIYLYVFGKSLINIIKYRLILNSFLNCLKTFPIDQNRNGDDDWTMFNGKSFFLRIDSASQFITFDHCVDKEKINLQLFLLYGCEVCLSKI